MTTKPYDPTPKALVETEPEAWPKGNIFSALPRSAPIPSIPLGLFDLHGNVWEWCADWYDAEYYLRSPRQDPQGPEIGDHRALRGSSWSSNGGSCRSAHRGSYAPGYRIRDIGFRVMLVLAART